MSLGLAIAAALGAMMWVIGAGWPAAAVFGAYGGVMCLRQFARAYAYIESRLVAVTASDVTYSAVVLSGLAVLFFGHQFVVPLIAAVLATAACVALFPFGLAYLKRQFTAGLFGWVGNYATIWRDLARWSFLGVVSTEMTANAHAYLVTLIAGPKSFALLAAGALFLRPVSLFLTALPEMERPAMARGIIARDMAAASRPVRTFRIATGLVWLASLAATAAILIWFPTAIPRHHYPVGEIAIVVALWAAIMAVRIVRTPDSVFMQAATEFRPLALASVWSAGVSLVLTLALLLIWGPVVSLGGILMGDVVMMLRIRMLVSRWKRRHA